MISLTSKGKYKKANSYLEKLLEVAKLGALDKYGQMGVEALKASTPVDSGETANSWSYIIEHDSSGAKIVWINSNAPKGVNIALILQYGHGTGTGGYVKGLDYINPAMAPIFDQIAEDAAKEVRRL